MNKKTIFKVLAGAGAALAGFGIFKLVSGGTGEDVDLDIVEDDCEYEDVEDVEEAE